MDNTPLFTWTFVASCSVPQDIGPFLVRGEQTLAAYKTFSDSAVFTDRRIIVRDAQGRSGKKVEVYSLPYAAITLWSTTNAGGFLDSTADLTLYTKAGYIKVNINKEVDIRKLDHLLSTAVLQLNGNNSGMVR